VIAFQNIGGWQDRRHEVLPRFRRGCGGKKGVVKCLEEWRRIFRFKTRDAMGRKAAPTGGDGHGHKKAKRTLKGFRGRTRFQAHPRDLSTGFPEFDPAAPNRSPRNMVPLTDNGTFCIYWGALRLRHHPGPFHETILSFLIFIFAFCLSTPALRTASPRYGYDHGRSHRPRKPRCPRWPTRCRIPWFSSPSPATDRARRIPNWIYRDDKLLNSRTPHERTAGPTCTS